MDFSYPYRYGVKARGEATAHSDVDLLVVFPELSSKREMTISAKI